MAGSFGWGGGKFISSLVEHDIAAEVLVCTSVSDSMLAVLLGGAVASVLPSYYEGFGLGVLEAMAAGRAVICSSAEALTEVAGDSACVVQTGDVEAWADAMSRLAEQQDYRQNLQRMGLQRAKMFSWDTAAAQHVELFTRIAN